MRSNRVRRLAAMCAPGAVLIALCGALPAHAVSTDVMIAEVYGGGGNSGGVYRYDYIELFNTSDSAVDLSGWSVAYFSAGSTSTTPSDPTPLSGSIGAGSHYLVQEAPGGDSTEPALPTPEATGTLGLSSTGGRVEVLDPSGNVVDLLGWGAAVVSEGPPAGATTSATSVARTSACVDTDNNSADFSVGAPGPQSSSTAAVTCGTQPPPQSATIEQVQGASQTSPLVGDAVSGVTGVVTDLTGSGFYLESTTPDEDPATNEGLYVFTKIAPTVVVGDDVSVDGTVGEYTSGGSSSSNLSRTELDSPTVTVQSSGNPLPAPVVIGVDRVAPPQSIYAGNPGNIQTPGTTFDPSTNAIDFNESLEGMLVSLRNAKVVGPTNAYDETAVVPGQHVGAVGTPYGGVVYTGYDHPNSTRLILSTATLPSADDVSANVGDHFKGTVTGVMTYAFGNPEVDLTQPPTLVSGGLKREVTATPTADQLAVAAFNVENLAPTDPQTKFDRLAGQIVHNLKAPDVVALEEIQDSSGALDDGTVDSSTTTDLLIAAITTAGGPAYQASWINPVNDQDGGQPGGNIRQVFLCRTDRGLAFVQRAGGPATTADSVVGTGSATHLMFSPGRIDPTSSAWAASRKPLVGEFTFRGRTAFIIANHLIAKLGDDPLFGRYQQPQRSSQTQRHAQAQEIRTFVSSLLAANRMADVVVVGDINDFQFSQTANIMVGSGTTALLDLPRTLPLSEQDSYDYEGNGEVLDQILVSKDLAGRSGRRVFSYDIVHTNAEFADQDSDHDPQVVRLRLGR